MRSLALAVLVLASACGGSSTPTTTCAGTVMGSLKGSFSVCNAFDNIYRQNLDNFVFSAAYTELPTSFVFSTEWTIKDTPQTGTFNQDTRDVDCSISMKKGALTWLGRKGSGVPTSGTCALKLDSVEVRDAMGNATTYKVKGSVSGHLDAEPTSGAMGTVDVTMDFDG